MTDQEVNTFLRLAQRWHDRGASSVRDANDAHPSGTKEIVVGNAYRQDAVLSKCAAELLEALQEAQP